MAVYFFSKGDFFHRWFAVDGSEDVIEIGRLTAFQVYACLVVFYARYCVGSALVEVSAFRVEVCF